MKHYLFAATALFMMLACSCGSSDQKTEDTVHSVLVVKPQPIGNSVSKTYSGIVAESKTISLGFKTAGQIENTYVKEGDYVRAGQLIATLDDSDYQLGLREATVQYNQMKSEQERLDYLYQTNNVSENDYEKSKAGLERLKINLENCQNKVKYTKLYAPVSGYVVKLNFEKAEMVNAGTPVIELMDNSQLEVDVDLPAQAYANRSMFRNFTATTVQGEVISLSLINITPKADNNQLYSMRLAITSKADANALTAGMNVEVEAEFVDNSISDEHNNEFEVPIRSVFYDNNNKPQVWTLATDSTVVATGVELGDIRPNGKITVVSGLKGDETIVRAGVNSLQQGEKVSVIEDAKHTNVGNLL